MEPTNQNLIKVSKVLGIRYRVSGPGELELSNPAVLQDLQVKLKSSYKSNRVFDCSV